MSSATPEPETQQELFDAVVYLSSPNTRHALSDFVKSLKQDGVHVGGVLQETFRIPEGDMRGINIIDVETERRIPINYPTREEWDNRVCSLDVSALAETSVVLKRAIERRPDLIVVEKFGNSEKDGKGLMEEIFQAIVEGIPLLVAVPEAFLEDWAERSGGMGATIPHELDAIRAWWDGLPDNQ